MYAQNRSTIMACHEFVSNKSMSCVIAHRRVIQTTVENLFCSYHNNWLRFKEHAADSVDSSTRNCISTPSSCAATELVLIRRLFLRSTRKTLNDFSKKHLKSRRSNHSYRSVRILMARSPHIIACYTNHRAYTSL